MKCMICTSKSDFYFSKSYTQPPYDEFMREIGEVDYYKCNHCGFVFSKTHQELEEKTWEKLNQRFHHYLENPQNDSGINQPPYAEQALMIILLGENGIINTENMLDYAAGYGTLSNLLEKYFNLTLPISDPYVSEGESSKFVPQTALKTYSTVINSAMFEHVLSRKDLDQVNDLVDERGCLIIHTVVCENIPKDPNWFYLEPPVHSAFHTNKSMNILMEQWGYRSSIYCKPAKCWILLKDNVKDIESTILAINQELQNDWFFYKKGFVNYWMGF